MARAMGNAHAVGYPLTPCRAEENKPTRSTGEIARLAGELQNRWRKKGRTLSLPDVTIATVALTHGLTPLTDNRKDSPMPELALYSLP